MRALRSLLPSPLAVGPGGEDNLSAPYSPGAYAELLPLQLRAVAEAVDTFVAALAAVSGVSSDRLRGAVRVQQAEFCRDYPYEDGAEHFVRRLRERLCVPRAAPGLLGAGVAAELAHLARGAGALLDEAVDVLNEALVAVPRTGADFLLAFAPLLRLAAPAPKRAGAAGRPRGAEVEPLANLALERLLAEGKFDMRGQHQTHPVLLALREMQAAGALAVAEGMPRLFTVAPGLEAARQALAGAGIEPLGGGGEGEAG